MRVSKSLPCSWKMFCELEPCFDCCDVLINFLTCSEDWNKLLTWAMNGWKILEQPKRKVLTSWGGDWWRTCYSLKIEVRVTSKWISEAVWMTWSRNTWGKMEFECKNQGLAGIVFVFATLNSWEILTRFQGSSFQLFLTSLQLPMKFHL